MASGTLAVVRLKASIAGQVKVAIYDDNNGSPNNLLTSTSGLAVDVGWNKLSVSPISIINGVDYWEAVKVQANGNCRYDNLSRTIKWKSEAYANAWPDPAGSGYSNNSFHSLMAGYGDT